MELGHRARTLDRSPPRRHRIELHGNRLFRGPLPAGEHRIAGILLYPGADHRGRRNAKMFDRTFEVTADVEIAIDDLKPRWPD